MRGPCFHLPAERATEEQIRALVAQPFDPSYGVGFGARWSHGALAMPLPLRREPEVIWKCTHAHRSDDAAIACAEARRRRLLVSLKVTEELARQLSAMREAQAKRDRRLVRDLERRRLP